MEWAKFWQEYQKELPLVGTEGSVLDVEQHAEQIEECTNVPYRWYANELQIKDFKLDVIVLPRTGTQK